MANEPKGWTVLFRDGVPADWQRAAKVVSSAYPGVPGLRPPRRPS